MWIEKDNALQADFEFRNFTEAFAFLCEVAFAAEKMDHHPKWTNVWNKVHFELNTHIARNKVTQKDHDLARAIDRIAEKYTIH